MDRNDLDYYIEDSKDRAEMRIEELSQVESIARELIDFIIQKYNVKSLDGFTCPIHRRLAEALEVEFPEGSHQQ